MSFTVGWNLSSEETERQGMRLTKDEKLELWSLCLAAANKLEVKGRDEDAEYYRNLAKKIK